MTECNSESYVAHPSKWWARPRVFAETKEMRTLHCILVMSALPPKADIAARCHHVRFVPSKLMSGVTGAIAPLALGLPVPPGKPH